MKITCSGLCSLRLYGHCTYVRSIKCHPGRARYHNNPYAVQEDPTVLVRLFTYCFQDDDADLSSLPPKRELHLDVASLRKGALGSGADAAKCHFAGHDEVYASDGYLIGRFGEVVVVIVDVIRILRCYTLDKVADVLNGCTRGLPSNVDSGNLPSAIEGKRWTGG